MLLKLNNIGMIKEANIEFNGLTVIAGENDTGKSTVGKLLFSIIKSFSRYEQDLDEDKKKNIMKLVERTYFLIRRFIDFQRDTELRRAFYPVEFLNEIQTSLLHSDKSAIDMLFDAKIRIIEQAIASLNTRESIIHSLSSLKDVILRDDKKEDIIKRALNKAFISEFYLEISNKMANENTKIGLLEGENSIFDIIIDNNKVQDLQYYDTLYFNDVTYIETPIILQMYDVINRSSTLFEVNDAIEKSIRVSHLGNPKVSLHMKDLISKLENAQYIDGTIFDLDTNPLRDDISNLINGSMSFNKDEKDFIFSKKVKTNRGNKKIDVKSVNVATGIKAFGIIQLLIQSQILDERSLLIIDEPEIHLHPKWQVEYARLIVNLIKSDLSVLVTSHSPYIIQAFKYFSEKEKLKDKVNFYLAEKTDGNSLSTIYDVTKNLNKVFKKLSDPLKELVWSDLC